jgi:hypothetical protein
MKRIVYRHPTKRVSCFPLDWLTFILQEDILKRMVFTLHCLVVLS